ncbi:hypothetical protein Syun_024692 [Stephania yunnanensis]|uniref:Uncharacterized protein n=1 Tax=Stephania yunnanensis TaxID=152371 RepID=A0AAP0HU88_9MAGN
MMSACDKLGDLHVSRTHGVGRKLTWTEEEKRSREEAWTDSPVVLAGVVGERREAKKVREGAGFLDH